MAVKKLRPRRLAPGADRGRLTRAAAAEALPESDLTNLSEADEFNRTLIEALQVGVLVQNPHGEIVLCNSKALQLLGLTREQLVGRTWLDPDWKLVHKDSTPFPGSTHPVPAAIATLKPVHDVVMGVYRASTQDRVWLLVNADPQLKSDGNVHQVICTFSDISQQKRAERDLDERERRLLLALRGGDLGWWDWNLATGKMNASERWLSLHGLDPGGPAPTVEQWRAMVHPDDLSRLDQQFHELLEDSTGVDHEIELRVSQPRGRIVWLLGRASVVQRGLDGRPLLVAGTHRDISERKRLAALQKKNEERWSAIVSNAPVPLAIYDENQRISFLNAAFVKTFGYDVEDIPTVEDWWPKAYPDPVYREQISSAWWAESQRMKRTRTPFSPIEATVRCKDGSYKTILATAVALSETMEGEYVVTLYDITERKLAQAAKQESEQFLLEAIANFPGTLAYWGRDLRCKIANQGFQQWFGRTEDQMKGIRIQELLGRERYAAAEPYIDAVLKGEDQHYERTLTKPDGSVGHLLIQKVAHRNNGEVDGFFAFMMDVTAIKRDQEKLRTTDVALNSISQGVVVAGPDRLINWTNDAFLSITGYTADEVIGRTCAFLQGLQTDPQTVQKIGQALDQQTEFSGEILNYRKDGTPFWNDLTITPVRGTEGELSRFIGVIHDVTERKRGHALQRESEQFLLEAIEKFPGMLAYWGSDLRCRIANSAYLRWFGRGREQMKGIYLPDLLGEELFKQNEPYIRAALQGDAQEFERTIIRVDGSVGHTLIQYLPRRVNGDVVGFFAYLIDVTAIRRDQEQLRISDIALSSISQGVLISSPERTILWANDAFLRLTGFSKAEVIGRKCCAFIEGPLTDQRTIASISEARQRGAEFAGEILNYRKDGTTFWNDLSLAPVRDIDGQITHFISVIRDVTERKRAEEQKAKLEADLQQSQKLESVGRLAGGIAHDFNNMLMVILGHAELVMNQTDVGEPLRDPIEEIYKAATRSAELTGQLLSFARKQTVAPKVLDLNRTVAGMCKMLERLVGNQVNLVLRLNADPCLVKLDPSQIDQIVVNLCVNARDAMAGAGKITIETGNRRFSDKHGVGPGDSAAGDYVWLAVSDTGVGMDKETQSHIFEPFFTTKEVGKGTGLGLATVYGAVRQNDGFIEVKSDPGAGATFTVNLPRYVEEQGIELAQLAAESPLRGDETILLVESEPAILRLAETILSEQGYTVLKSNNGEEAIKLAASQKGTIHLLLADLILPGLTGTGLAKRILLARPSIRTLFMSGYPADVIGSSKGGEKVKGNFLPKPFSRQQLIEKVREILDKQ